MSGYLITTLLRIEHDSSGTVSLKQFYLRRAFRILPPFYLVLTLAIIAASVGVISGGFSRHAVAAQFLHLANYWSVRHGGEGQPAGTGVYWSLAVEEHFYLLFPCVYLLLRRHVSGGFRQAAVLWGLCALVLAWRCVLVYGAGSPPDRTYLASDTRIDSILFGCALAVFANPMLDGPSRISDARWKHLMLPGGIALLLVSLVFRDPRFRETFRYSLQGVALYPLFVVAMRFPKWSLVRVLNTPVLAFIGVLSYSLYLVHHVVLSALRGRAGRSRCRARGHRARDFHGDRVGDPLVRREARRSSPKARDEPDGSRRGAEHERPVDGAATAGGATVKRPKRSSPGGLAGLVVLAVVICMLTLVGLALGDGNLAIALGPVLVFALAYAALKLPLRWPVLILTFLALTLENPSEVPAEGQWRSPLYTLGALLLAHLNVTLPYKALLFSGLDVILVFIGVVIIWRNVTHSKIDGVKRAQTPRPLLILAGLSLAATAWVWTYGYMRGGADVASSLWQIERVVYLPIFFFVFQRALRGSKDVAALAKVLVAAACIKAVLAIYIMHTVPPPPGSPMPTLQYATTHPDSMFFAGAACCSWPSSRAPSRKDAIRALLLLPLLIAGMVANNRRIVWVELATGLAVVWLLTPGSRYEAIDRASRDHRVACARHLLRDRLEPDDRRVRAGPHHPIDLRLGRRRIDELA